MKDLLITIHNGGDEAVEAAQKLQALGEWVAVSERVPEGYKRVLVCLDNRAVCEAAFNPQYGWFETEWRCYRPTHWMPLPEPPEVT